MFMRLSFLKPPFIFLHPVKSLRPDKLNAGIDKVVEILQS